VSRRDPQTAGGWDKAAAERHLLGLERFGMRFGLDRMRRLTSALSRPQDRFRAVHVVGSNGKSSTTRMIAALLEREGLRTGAYLSPHLVSFTERIRVGERDIDGADFAAAVARAARAAELVERSAPADERVTQFELLTGAALSELARRGVDVAVLEAGLGGRWDATNVVGAPVVVLTNIGLEHQRWLGPTVSDIAQEKLAVLGDGAALVVGPLHADAEAEAERAAARHGAPIIRAHADDADPVLAALGGFQRDNFAVARAAATTLLGRPLSAEAVREAAAATRVPGRLERVADDPPTYHDGAHNAEGMRALSASLPEVTGARPLVAVVSVLDDKDAAAMLGALLPYCASVVLTASAHPRALPPGTLASLARQLLGAAAPPAELVADPRAALRRARGLAAATGASVLVTGSLYLLADLRRPVAAGQGSRI